MSLARGLNILIPSSQNVSNHVHGTCFSAKKPVTAAREGVPAFVRVTPRDIFEVCQFPALFVATDPDTFWVEVRRSVCGEAKWYFDLKLDHLYPCLWRENILYFILFLYFYFKGNAGCLWPRLWRGKKKYFWHVCGHKTFIFDRMSGHLLFLWLQKSDIFDGKLGHLQPCLWQERIDVFDSKSRHLQPCL